jgi:hypothetical protein
MGTNTTSQVQTPPGSAIQADSLLFAVSMRKYIPYVKQSRTVPDEREFILPTMMGIVTLADGRVLFLSQPLKNIFLIYEHYKLQGERVVGIVCSPDRKNELFEALVIGDREGFEVKVRVADGVVREVARQEP